MHSKPSGQETVLAAAEVGRTQAALSLKAFLPASTVCLKTRYLPCALGGPHSSLLPVYYMGPDFSQPSGPQERLEKEKRLTSDLGVPPPSFKNFEDDPGAADKREGHSEEVARTAGKSSKYLVQVGLQG